MTTGQLVGVAVGLIAALLFGVGAVVQAHAVRRTEVSPLNPLRFLLRSVRDPLTMLVVVAYLIGFVLHAVAIWLLPLYLAQATIAMSLPITALASTAVAERLTWANWTAIGVVTLGLVLLAIGSGEVGSVVTTAPFALAVWSGVAALALASWWSARLSGGALGALAGLGYAGSAVAVRGVGSSLEAGVAVAALAIPAYSLVAFWLYSIGMHRAAVSSTTAPLIVSQTFVPAAVGVVFLGDGVRDGWAPAVAIGLVLSTAGAVWLSRADLRSPVSAETESLPGPAPRSDR